MRIIGRLGLFVMAALAMASPASAQDDERARMHFASGRSYFEEGAYANALQEFQRAYELSPRVEMLFNIGTTQERLGMLEEAASTFEQYLEGRPDVENADVLRRRIANLRRRAAEERQSGSAATPPPSGTGSSSTSTTPPATTPSGGGDGLMLGGIVSLGVAGAALVSFAIFGGLTLAEQSAVEGGCFASRSCTAADVSTMDTFALITDVSWPIALAAGAAGAVLVALGASSGGGERASLRVAPWATAGSAGAIAEGSF